MRSNVFVADGHWGKTLAAVRCLGRQGVAVTVGESTWLNTASFSRYCSRKVVYPSPLSDPSGFVDFMRTELSARPYRMLLPMEDETLELMALHHKEISGLTYLPSVSHEKLLLARSKDKILQLAESIGLPIPKTWFIDDLSRLDEIKDRLPYPVVIKPRRGSGAMGIAYPQNPADLKSEYHRIHQRFPFPMIQERIPTHGAGYGASFLMDEQSRVKASFVHKRLREYPVTGGASTLRESVRNDEIREMGLSLLKAINWFGVAMVEFKMDPRDNRPKLMEINPRFWGSLALAIESGVNFPYLAYQMACGENFKPVEQYQIGKRCRWLLPGDILHFMYNPDRLHLTPSFFNFFDPNTAYDILSVQDPLPVVASVMTPLTFLYDRDMKERLRRRGDYGKRH